MLLVVLVGGFTLVGGLGGSFYVSYFTCATIFGLMLFFVFEIFYNPFGNVKVNLAFKTGTIISSDWPCHSPIHKSSSFQEHGRHLTS